MKKVVIALSLFVAVILVGCSKDDPATTTMDPVKKEIVNAILDVSFGGLDDEASYAPASLVKQRSASADSSDFFSFSETYTNPLGGSVALTGKMSMSQTATSTKISMVFSELFKNYVLEVESGKYTSNGTITYTGDYVIAADGTLSATSNIAGSLVVTGSNYNQTISIAVKITQTYDGKNTKVTMTGTMGGEVVNYSESVAGQL